MRYPLKIPFRELLTITGLAILIGISVGILDTLFGKVLLLVSRQREAHFYALIPFLALAGLGILLLYRKFSLESAGGMDLIFETSKVDREHIPKGLIPLVMVSTWITHLFGGSAGREGVAMQLGASISHSLGHRIKGPSHSTLFLLIGMAAGFAGLFQTPLAASFFAIEILIAGAIFWSAFLPIFTAAFVASTTSHLLGLEKFSFPLSSSIGFSPSLLLKLIALGLLLGLGGRFFTTLLHYAKQWVVKRIKNPFHRIFLLGLLLSFLMLILPMDRYSGLGTNLISASFSGEGIFAYDWLLKLLLTIITLSAGFQGGEVTPLFAIGASLGILLGNFLGLPLLLAAALGYAALFGSATNTLIAPVLIGAEVFGYANLPYFALVCTLAYGVNGNHSIYAMRKSKVNR